MDAVVWVILTICILSCIAVLRFLESFYQGPPSDHFDGKHFFNFNPVTRGIKDFLKWISTRQPIPWPETKKIGPQAVPRKRVGEQELLVTFVNHATILIQWNGLNILTDPIWSERAGPLGWLGPKRVHPPGIAFEDLPPIDLVLISHNHYDSLDLPTLKQLYSKHQPCILVGLGIKRYLDSKGLENVQELDWWQQAQVPFDIDAFFTPAQHFSARGFFDRDKTLWGGFVLKQGRDMLYFSGDTAYCDAFKQVKERFGVPRLAILPIGAYEPRWFMQPAHMSPQEAVQAHLDLEAKNSLAYHFGTFQLADEGINDPPLSLKKEMERLQIPLERFWILEVGQSKNVP